MLISGGSRGVKTSKVLLSGGLMNVEPPGPPTGRRRLANDFRVHAKDFRLLQKCLDPWWALKGESITKFYKENINSSGNKLIDLWTKQMSEDVHLVSHPFAISSLSIEEDPPSNGAIGLGPQEQDVFELNF